MQQAVVGREALDHAFHHRMAPLFDVDPGFRQQMGSDPLIGLGMMGEGAQDVQRGQRRGQAVQHRDGFRKLIQQLFEQPLLPAQRAVLRGKHLVFPLLQFRRNEAFRVFQGLTAAVFGRDLVQLRAADFNEEAVHAVVFDTEGADAGAFPFTGFQVQQNAAGFAFQRAQGIQLFIKAHGNHAAIAHVQGGFFGDGALQQSVPAWLQIQRGGHLMQQGRRGFGQRFPQRGQHAGHAGQRVAQAGQFLGPDRAQRDAGGNALNVRQGFQLGAEHLLVALPHQLDNGLLPLLDGCIVAQRVVQPMAQQAAAHRGMAVVERGKQGGGTFATQRLGNFQVATGHRVQVHVLRGPVHANAEDVRQPLGLRMRHVAQQGTGGALRQRQRFQIEAGQGVHRKMLKQVLARIAQLKMPDRHGAETGDVVRQQGLAFGQQQLGGGDSMQFAGQHVGRAFGHGEGAIGQVQPGQARGLVRMVLNQRRHADIRLGRQQGLVGQCAGGDGADDLALDRPFGGGRIADLFANRDGLAEFDQPRQVLIHRMKRHARHLDRLPAGTAARGQCQVKQAGRFLGVFVKEFVEIAHAIQQQRRPGLGFEAVVLLHHRRVVGEIGCRHLSVCCVGAEPVCERTL